MPKLSVDSELRTIYENAYKNGESEWRALGARDKADSIVRLCSLVPHDSILEIGAGDGAVLKQLSQKGFGSSLYAVEISESAVQVMANQTISNLKEVQLFDGYSIPYDDHQFDLVVLTHVLEHVEHPRMLLREAARVARHVFIEVPLEDNMRLANQYIPDEVGHINFFSNQTFRLFIQTCGLEVLNQRVVHISSDMYTYRNGWKGWINYFIKEGLLRLCKPLATRLFTYHGAILCKR